MTDFETVDEVSFEFTNILTWGVSVNEHHGYSVPISVDRESAAGMNNLSRKHKTKSSVYGKYNTVYLKVGNLTTKQKKELLDAGRCRVDIAIRLIGVNTARNDERYLSFKIIKLRKVEKRKEIEEADEECAKDY